MTTTEEQYNNYLSFLLSGNKTECTKIIRELIDQKIAVKDLYLNFFQRSMYQVGSLWEHNKISVAVEHMATAMTESLLNLAYPLIFSAEHCGKSAIISCVTKEYHQIGAKMVADIFELNGWDGYFVGANTPTDELLKMIDDKKPDVLALSMSLYFSLRWMEEMLQAVSATHPKLDIIVGGQGFLWGGLDTLKKYPQVEYVDSIIKLEQLIKKG
ncbi:MAG: cobalamin-dependent protein [SAR324 cluster bacterium]|nr:cobalamin-dependent protein [SAR324 cluster bacterium]